MLNASSPSQAPRIHRDILIASLEAAETLTPQEVVSVRKKLEDAGLLNDVWIDRDKVPDSLAGELEQIFARERDELGGQIGEQEAKIEALCGRESELVEDVANRQKGVLARLKAGVSELLGGADKSMEDHMDVEEGLEARGLREMLKNKPQEQ